MAEGIPHIYPLLRELAGKTAVKGAEGRTMEWINRANAAAAVSRNPPSKSTYLGISALPPAAALMGGLTNLSTPHFDIEYAYTPKFSHAMRVVAAQPTIASHTRTNNGNAFHVELEEVVTEKSSFHGSLACSGGDKEFFDVDRQDSSDDEEDDEEDDVDVEKLVVDHHSHQ
ncbi:hypothetical protein EDD21DRAFT_393378 [Dissophora ornata]|nr:hypothetical protein EDD21DRAFT_393378 [Dissophora ornata]